MILTRLEKNLDDSDSRGLWLWLDKNDSDTSLLNLTKQMWEDMAYYIPTVWKSGGTRPPCLPPNCAYANDWFGIDKKQKLIKSFHT